jgi:hypothetical protein
MTRDSSEPKPKGSSSRRRPCEGTRKGEDVPKKVKVVHKSEFQYPSEET